jgi:hypothetical protein
MRGPLPKRADEERAVDTCGGCCRDQAADLQGPVGLAGDARFAQQARVMPISQQRRLKWTRRRPDRRHDRAGHPRRPRPAVVVRPADHQDRQARRRRRPDPRARRWARRARGLPAAGAPARAPAPGPAAARGAAPRARRHRSEHPRRQQPRQPLAFPATAPHSHWHPALRQRFQARGLPATPGRTSALRQHVLQAPAPGVAAVLGYNNGTGEHHRLPAGRTGARGTPDVPASQAKQRTRHSRIRQCTSTTSRIASGKNTTRQETNNKHRRQARQPLAVPRRQRMPAADAWCAASPVPRARIAHHPGGHRRTRPPRPASTRGRHFRRPRLPGQDRRAAPGRRWHLEPLCRQPPRRQACGQPPGDGPVSSTGPGLRGLLAKPAYRRLWLARTISRVGDVAQFTTWRCC